MDLSNRRSYLVSVRGLQSSRADLFAAARLGASRARSRSLRERAAWPGFSLWRRLGDVAANLRYDLTFAGDRPWWPGVAVLAGLSVPTGRTVEDSADPTGAPGIGAFEGNLGVAVEQVMGRSFVSVTGFVVQQTARTVGSITQTLGPRLTALVAGGYAFASELTVGGFVLGTRGRDQSLVTAGVALAIPIDDHWRVQGTWRATALRGWGRNQSGAGVPYRSAGLM